MIAWFLLNLSAVCVRAFTPKRTLFRGALKSVSVGRVRAVECYSDAFGKKIKENCISFLKAIFIHLLGAINFWHVKMYWSFLINSKNKPPFLKGIYL